MKEEIITILCSGVTLGVYIPGLIVNYQLKEIGYYTEVVVLESLLLKGKQQNIPNTKLAFHRDFSVALMGQKLAGTIVPSMDADLVSALLTTWKNERRKHFIIFSGFWLPIIDKYLCTIGFKDVLIDLCHMDAALSTSWKSYKTDHPCFRHVWLLNWDKKNISYCLYTPEHEVVPYFQRINRFVIHGGGWGIGTYKNKIPQLEERGIKLDVITYEKNDIENEVEGNRYFMIDPDWKPWEKNEQGIYQFPPFGEIKGNNKIEFRNNKQFPEIYHLIKRNRAIISKPGGSTLLDSLSFATPLVLLEPFGEYESKNALLWEYLGFGISYQKWIDYDCSLKILERLHTNLLKAKSTIHNYVKAYYATPNNSQI